MTQTKDGLTEQEIEIMDALAIAWNGWAALEMQHPSEIDDFVNGTHMPKNLAMRALRRGCPDAYSIISKGGEQDEG